MDYNRPMSERPNRSTEAPMNTAPRGPSPQLTSAQRAELRGRAHGLSPVVMIGDAGLSESVVSETDRALDIHGLIKVRVHGDDRAAREALGLALSEQLACALVQTIGKLLVLWREPLPTDPVRAPIRRRVATAPKKLAAEGKPAPKKKARPGVPRAETPAKPVRRKAPPRHARTIGPGSRTARGALNPAIKPVMRASIDRDSAADHDDDGVLRAGRASAPPARSRPSAARSATAGASPKRPSTAGKSARSGVSSGAKKPRSTAVAGKPAPRKSAAPAKTSAARKPASGKPRTPQGGSSATRSERPAPRSRAGRRVP